MQKVLPATLVMVMLSNQVLADVIVDSVDELVTAVNNTGQSGDKTILVADGTYNLNGSYLRIATDGVTVRSESGERSAVVLDGNQKTTEIFQIVASNVTIQDMTLMRAQDHPIHVVGSSSGNTDGTLLQNLHIIDPGQQAIKINTSSGYTTENGIISDSLIELTDEGRAYVWEHNGSCYTGGIDGHEALNWTIRDNTIEGFWCADGLSEHGIHLWSGSTDNLVERNLIIDCDRGIGFGLGESSPHYGGIIRNNMIYHPEDHGQSDVGIGLESASDVQVYNNTIFLNHDYSNAIEYRFSASTGNTIYNNLTNKSISSRNSGEAVVAYNVTSALSTWFVNPAAGDLHLLEEISDVVNVGKDDIDGLTDDFDKGSRPYNGGVDIGADEYGSPADLGQETKNSSAAATVINSTLLLLDK